MNATTEVPSTVNPPTATTPETNTRSVLLPYVIIIVAQFPLLFMYFKNLWETRPHYAIFPFAFIVFGAFLYMRWPRDAKNAFFRSRVSACFFVVGIMFAIFATVFVTPWFAFFSTLCFISSLLARTRDQETGRSLLPIVLPLVVFLQPPSGLDFDTVHGDRFLITGLQSVAANVSSNFLDLMGFQHNLVGTVIQVPDKASDEGVAVFGVEEACSGVTSFFTLLFMTSVFIVAMRRPLLRALLLMVAAVFWAIVMNSVRILLIPIAKTSMGIDLSHGLQHDILGWTVLAAGFLLVISTDQLLYFVLGPVDTTAVESSNRFRRRIASFWNRVVAGSQEGTDSDLEYGSSRPGKRVNQKRAMAGSARYVLWGTAIAMCLLFLVQIIDVRSSLAQPQHRVRFFDTDVTVPLSEHNLPAQINDWQQVLYKTETRPRASDLGERSDFWVYRNASPMGARYDVITSFDQPFPGWHELTTCYKAQGWKMTKRVRREEEIEQTGDSWPYIEAEFETATGKQGFLVFSHFDRFGEPYEAPETWGSLNSLASRISNRLSHRVRARLFRGESYQSQAFVESAGELPEEIKEQIRSGYLVMREHLRDQFASGALTDEPLKSSESSE